MTIRYPKKHRLRDAAYADPENTFHVVVRAFPASSPFSGRWGRLVWGLAQNEFERGSIKPRAICLMPDHLHVIASPRERSILRWVQGFKSYSTRVLRDAGLVGPAWQPSFYDRLVRDDAEMTSVIRYVWRNPVEAGLVGGAREWPWTQVCVDDAWVCDE